MQNIKDIKREANKSFNSRKKNKKQIIISSSISDRNRVFYTNYPLKKLQIINPLLEQDTRQNDKTGNRRIFERNSKI